MVQFRAMVTPCMPTCPPVTCDVLDYTGQTRQVESYGRKKRSSALMSMSRTKRQAAEEEVLLVQTLHIVDKNQLQQQRRNSNLPQIATNSTSFDSVFRSAPIAHCLEENTLISGAVVFLVIQVIILTMFVFLWKRKRDSQAKEVITPPESTTDSLSYMYESGYTRRLH